MNKLALPDTVSGLTENRSKQLLESYSENFAKAQALVAQSRDIVVTNETQTDLMSLARENRLKLKNVRVEVEKTRVSLKEQIVREGKAIDGLANVIKALIVPVEEHLQLQEDFVKIKQAKIAEEKAEKRRQELFKYEVEGSEFNLVAMSDEAYDQLLNNSKLAFEAKQERERKAEEERIQAEKARLAEEKRLREENARLQKEAEERERRLAKERAEMQAREEKLRKETEEANRKLEAERQAKLEKERQQAQALEAERQAEIEKQLAPDKEKLRELANTLEAIPMPAVSSKGARDLISTVEATLREVATNLREANI